MDVVTMACQERVEDQSVTRKPIEYKALQASYTAWPTPCLNGGRVGVAASTHDLILLLFNRRVAHLA